ncbi:MAG TPA: DUF952 domain-containing protein [Rhizobium sp.]|nr:DUF952 domain-containing protein [Rhizobium sp.]
MRQSQRGEDARRCRLTSSRSQLKDEAVTATVYKIVPEQLWQQSQPDGVFLGAPIDLADGFIHFSTATQARETARLHFAGQTNLLLIAVDGASLGDKLVFEPSRGGDLFPHLYGVLPHSSVLWQKPLPLGADGLHVFPEDMA